MQRHADRFDAASEIRIVAPGTDLTLGIAGRSMEVDAAGANIPGGEFFCCPLEDSARGGGSPRSSSGLLRTRATRHPPAFRVRSVVDASAEGNEEFLLEILDSDDGAGGSGELSIGCNPASCST